MSAGLELLAGRALGEKYSRWQTLTMRKVLILVEGQTEERFVKDVLQPYLWGVDVHPSRRSSQLSV
jgi:hypothetical protein